jgi:hypothetical protein
MKAYRGVDIQIHVFLTSTLDGGEWSASRLSRFTPGSLWIGGWVGLITGVDDVEKILDPTGAQTRSLGRPARSQSLYRLSCPGCY